MIANQTHYFKRTFRPGIDLLALDRSDNLLYLGIVFEKKADPIAGTLTVWVSRTSGCPLARINYTVSSDGIATVELSAVLNKAEDMYAVHSLYLPGMPKGFNAFYFFFPEAKRSASRMDAALVHDAEQLKLCNLLFGRRIESDEFPVVIFESPSGYASLPEIDGMSKESATRYYMEQIAVLDEIFQTGDEF